VSNAGGFGSGRGAPAEEGEPGRVRFNPGYTASSPEALPSWQIDLRQQISRLRTSLMRTPYEEPDRDLAARIDNQLRAAEERLGQLSGQGWLRRHFLADGVYEQVLASVLAASEDLVLIEDEGTVRARIPAIRAALKAFIDVDDPRFDDYLHTIDGVAASGPPGNGTAVSSLTSDGPESPYGTFDA
jgi:hypothetical protein